MFFPSVGAGAMAGTIQAASDMMMSHKANSMINGLDACLKILGKGEEKACSYIR